MSKTATSRIRCIQLSKQHPCTSSKSITLDIVSIRMHHILYHLSLRIRAREEADGGATRRRLPPTERGFAFTTKCPRPEHSHKMTDCACGASVTLLCAHDIGAGKRPHRLGSTFVLLLCSLRSACMHGFAKKVFPDTVGGSTDMYRSGGSSDRLSTLENTC